MQIDLSDKTIETERLFLRFWKQSDLDDFFEYCSVPGVGEMAGWPSHESIEASKEILNKFLEEKSSFAIVNKVNQKVIGSLGLHKPWTDGLDEYQGLNITEIGYVLSKDFWGQGLMTEAMKAAISFCFSELKLDAIACGHFTHNEKSRRVIEKCGFSLVRTGKYNATQLNKVFDDRQYILFNPNFVTAI